VSERADPQVVAAGEGIAFPSGSVSEDVVVATERVEVIDSGWSALGPGDAMVEVTVGRRHATPGKDAGAVTSFDMSTLAGGRPPAGDAGVDRLTSVGICDAPAPFGLLLLFGDLTGDVGDDRSVTGQFSRILCQPDQSGQVDVKGERSFPNAGVASALYFYYPLVPRIFA
jgi:hypothetical protein